MLSIIPNGSSANIKLSKTQSHNIRQSRGFLGRLLELLLKTGLSLIGNVLEPLAKSLSIPLGSAATAMATDAAIPKKMLRSGARPLCLASLITLIIFNKEMTDIIKIVNSLEKS